MRIAGIDPGKTGVVVVLDAGAPEAWSYRLRFDKAGVLDGGQLRAFLAQQAVELCLLERVTGRGGWGASSTFAFGAAWGQIVQAMLFIGERRAMPCRLVDPQAWQKQMHAGTPATLDAKARSELAYRSLWPHDPLVAAGKRKLDHNAVDAWLIATYGVLKYGGGTLRQWALKTTDERTEEQRKVVGIEGARRSRSRGKEPAR